MRRIKVSTLFIHAREFYCGVEGREGNYIHLSGLSLWNSVLSRENLNGNLAIIANSLHLWAI